MPAQRNYVLIDYENVQPDLLPLLSETNIYVIVFVGAAQKSVPIDFAAAMQRLGSRATYIKLSGNGSNALDFHIAFYLGVLAVRDPAAYFHIISKDTGFDPLIQHMRAKQVKAHRFEDVTDIPIIKKKLAPPLPSASTHESGKNEHSAAPAFVDATIETVAPAMNGNSAQVQAPAATVETDAQACSSPASQNASNPSQRSRNERIAFVVVHLQKHRVTRPAKVATLRNHIHALFRKQLTDLEVDDIVIGMKRKNLISIGDDQRITYHLAVTVP
jgi:hypothetical protein